MVIVWVLVGLVVVVLAMAAFSFARDEVRLRRRAAAELPAWMPVPQTGLGDRQLFRDRGDRLDPRTSEVDSALPELRRVRSGHERHPSWRSGSASGDVSGARGQAQITSLAREVTVRWRV